MRIAPFIVLIIQIQYIEGRDLFISSNNMMQLYGGSSKLKIVDDDGMDINAKVIGTKNMSSQGNLVITNINDIIETTSIETYSIIISTEEVIKNKPSTIIPIIVKYSPLR